MLSTTRPTPLRLAGFLATVMGGAAIALGSVLAWATVTIGQIGTSNTLPPVDTRGVDTVEGKIAVALGVLVLVAIPAMRLARSRGGRRAWAVLVMVAGLVAGGIAFADAAQAFDRFSGVGCEQYAQETSKTTGLPFEALRDRCEEQTAKITDVALGPGIYSTIAGGVLAVIGGALSLAWAGRPTQPGTADARDEPAEGSGT